MFLTFWLLYGVPPLSTYIKITLYNELIYTPIKLSNLESTCILFSRIIRHLMINDYLDLNYILFRYSKYTSICFKIISFFTQAFLTTKNSYRVLLRAITYKKYLKMKEFHSLVLSSLVANKSTC